MEQKSDTGTLPESEVTLAERATDIRNAAELIRRAVSGIQSGRAEQLRTIAGQLDQQFDELHTIGIRLYAPELLGAER
ncbi:hypothetical protein [Mycobacteroides chelonae]|nr:hypothetical protein [Mycobacteroides chelonae]